MTHPPGKIHIYPLQDLRDHDISSSCWCRPRFCEESHAYIHNSMDGREQFETGERKPS